MVGGAGGWSTAARQPQPERCQLWRRRPLAARSGATARTSTQSAARGAALRRHGWHGHARCGACAGYGSSFFQVKSAYLTAKTPKISRLARRARGALRRLARLRRAGSQVYSFSDIGSKCFTYSEHHSELRIPCAHFGFQHIFLAVDRNTKDTFVVGMLGLTTEDVDAAQGQLRAYVKPMHGDIWIFRKDSLPAHRSLKMQDLLAASQTDNQLSPGGVHEGVGDAENGFLLGVPAANAMLLCSADLDEAHFFTAFRTLMEARRHSAIDGSDPPVSTRMLYEGKQEWIKCPLLGYGVPAKALHHPEFRNGKYEMHSFACVYGGPAHFSRSLRAARAV